ncbi:M36 family metallopeptidase [Alteromonadaceae bacterium BrNp21-10]|nr:M36 family metallopeptidase [Alteromonadaceae bacterium BrNp21-10]
MNKIGYLLISASMAMVAHSHGATAIQNKGYIPKVSFNNTINNNVAHAATSGFVGQSDILSGESTFRWHNTSATLRQRHPAVSAKEALTHSLVSRTATQYFQQAFSAPRVGEANLSQLQWQANKPVVAQYQQQINSITVINRQVSLLMDSQLNLIASSGNLSSLPLHKAGFQISQSQAIAAAFADIGGQINDSALQLDRSENQYRYFTATAHNVGYRLSGEQRIKKVYFAAEKNIIPAYYLEISTEQDNSAQRQHISFMISAIDGQVLTRKNLTAYENYSYLTFAQSESPYLPFDSPTGTQMTPLALSDMYDPDADQDEITESVATQNLITLSAGPIDNPEDNPWISAAASNHFRCQQQTQVTCGNNVAAYIDLGADRFHAEDGDFFASTTSSNRFEYVWDGTKAPTDPTNQNAAIVNMFFMVNWLHDWFYANGFDEAAGNAQIDNYGRGGIGGDPMLAEGQDRTQFSDGTDIPDENNANMSTPSDGGSPQMQMFLWDAVQKGAANLTGVTDLAKVDFSVSIFGEQNFNVQGEVAIVADDASTDSPTDGCQTLNNAADINGKIAIVDRGDCDFVVKVQNIQDAGGIAAIVVNNVDEGLVNMSGDTGDIVIPAIFIRQGDGNLIKSSIANNSVSADLTSSLIKRDSTLDNAVIAHEWGHYLTNRLVFDAAGLVSNQSRALGEGWGDFLALLFMAREEDEIVDGNANFEGLYNDGGYSVVGYQKNINGVSDKAGARIAYSVGIRRAPYTTNMEYNALTFKHIEDGVALPSSHYLQGGTSGSFNSEVHAAGEIWALALWTGYTNLIKAHGFAIAQERIKDYLVAGLKITPQNPTFTEARDAMLAAAYAMAEEDFFHLLDGFAARGLGIGAISPTRHSENNAGVVESFSNNALAITLVSVNTSMPSGFDCDADDIWDIGDSRQFTIRLKNSGVLDWQNVSLNLSSSANVTFSTGTSIPLAAGRSFGEEFDVVFSATLNSATFGQQVTINAVISGDPALDAPVITPITTMTNLDLTKALFTSDNESSLAALNDWQVEHTYALDDNDQQLWSLAAHENFPAQGQMWHGTDIGLPGQQSLISPVVSIATTGEFQMHFDHYYFFEKGFNFDDVETAWDGGVVEIKIDDGNWQDVTTAGGTFDIGYGELVIDEGNDYLAGRLAYIGYSGDILNEVITFADGLLNGKQVQFRFLIATDTHGGHEGWFVDNMSFNNITSAPFSDAINENGCGDSTSPVIGELLNFSINEVDNNGTASIVEIAASVTDSDGDELGYQWQYLGDETLNLIGADTATLSFSAPATTGNIELLFTLTVSDGQYQVSKDVVVTIIDTNTAPKISVDNANLSVDEGGSVSFTLTTSDEDGDEVRIQWTQASGTPTLTSDGNGTYTFAAPQVTSTTNYSYDFWAIDDEIQSDTISITITVNNVVAPTPTTPSTPSNSGGGGGGSLSILLILLLAIRGLLVSRRVCVAKGY